jgi:hypothetical protein
MDEGTPGGCCGPMWDYFDNEAEATDLLRDWLKDRWNQGNLLDTISQEFIEV